MKFILIVFIFFTPEIASAQANEFNGIWIFTGVGCRDKNTLSANSHKTKPSDSNKSKMSTASIYLKDGKATITALIKGERKISYINYTITDNKVIPSGVEGEPLQLIENRLILASPDENGKCSSDQVFVYVLGKAD